MDGAGGMNVEAIEGVGDRLSTSWGRNGEDGLSRGFEDVDACW